ncbi:MAG: 2-C-methyl-D-erythritol 4-phosphate cytidylyltransferase [Mangrovibacterium sp.]
MKKFVLIVAGGSGIRMGGDVPKQFLELHGIPILMRTIARFYAYDEHVDVIVVLPESQMLFWEQLCEQYGFKLPHRLAKGGSSRFQSVRNGLQLISEEGLVFIHDGVRPLVSLSTIKACEDGALAFGNALPVISLVDSIREISNGASIHRERSNYRLVQTPQTFKVSLIKEAFLQEESPFFTDDASVLESAGNRIHCVEGNDENIKITTKKDLQIASVLWFD